LAIGSKETAIAVLPITIPVYFLMVPLRKIDIFYKILAVISAIVLYFSLRLFVLGPAHFLGVETSIIENPLMFTDIWHRVATAFSILFMYVSKTFVPFNLCSDYSFNQIPVVNFFNFQTILGLLIFLFLSFNIFYFFRKQPVISLASAFFVFSYLPISNLFFPIGTIAGERLMFFPSLGLSIITAFLLLKICDYLKTKNIWSKRIILIIFITIIIVYIFIGINRSVNWLSETRLFVNAKQCAPHSILSLSNMGTVYYFEGRMAEAKQEFLASTQINDTYSKGLNNLGLVYWKEGNIKKAKEFYYKSMQTKFPYPGAYENMALLYLSQNDIVNARRWLRITLPNEQAVNTYLKNSGK
jgi:hypothetical protein